MKKILVTQRIDYIKSRSEYRDSIDQSSIIHIGYICQPGGSVADTSVIEACDEYNMVMYFTDTRLFHH